MNTHLSFCLGNENILHPLIREFLQFGAAHQPCESGFLSIAAESIKHRKRRKKLKISKAGIVKGAKSVVMNNNNNNYHDCISKAPFRVKHAQLC